MTSLWGCIQLLCHQRVAVCVPAHLASVPQASVSDENIPLAQSMGYRAPQTGEVGSRDLQGLSWELACRILCAPLTALCRAPQTLLILTALVVAAAFTGLGIKWAEEWRSARTSLQVSALPDTWDFPAVPGLWG